MPTYQYACKDCDYEFEQVQAFSDAALTVCPNCAGHLRKVYGSVGVVFKGSGFYRTDSRSGSGKASLAADHKGDSSSSHSATDTKATDTKPHPASALAASNAGSSSPAAASPSKQASSPAKAPAAAAG